jgi:phage baseplate assembly protein W
VYDLSHQWGTDLTVGPTGDVALVTGAVFGQQRVLRRLMTNPGDYIWQIDYGAGLAKFIGQPGNASQIEAVIRSQIFKEPAVARTPEPDITVQFDPTSSTGTVYVQIRYVDAPTGQTQVLSFSMNG